MRIARISASGQPTYVLAEDGSRRFIGLTGDPVFQKVEPSGEFYDADEVRLLSPVIPRSKAIVLAADAVGSGPASHTPLVVPNTAVIGPLDPVVAPAWAGETLTLTVALAIVAKTLVKDISVEDAPGLTLGYCLAARVGAAGVDPQLACLADTSCVLGPWIEVAEGQNPAECALTIEVGGTVTEVDPARVAPDVALSEASRMATLLPGDLVLVDLARLDVVRGVGIEVAHPRLGEIGFAVIDA